MPLDSASRGALIGAMACPATLLAGIAFLCCSAILGALQSIPDFQLGATMPLQSHRAPAQRRKPARRPIAPESKRARPEGARVAANRVIANRGICRRDPRVSPYRVPTESRTGRLADPAMPIAIRSCLRRIFVPLSAERELHPREFRTNLNPNLSWFRVT
jgi:hypothetical protein